MQKEMIAQTVPAIIMPKISAHLLFFPKKNSINADKASRTHTVYGMSDERRYIAYTVAAAKASEKTRSLRIMYIPLMMDE